MFIKRNNSKLIIFLYIITFLLTFLFILNANVSAATYFNHKITNITFDGFAISWVSDVQELGYIIFYSTNPNSNPYFVYDVRSSGYSGYTHYVEINELDANTAYFYAIQSGSIIDNNNNQLYSVKTALPDSKPPEPSGDRAAGYIKDEFGNSVSDAIVYLKIIDSNTGMASSELSLYSVNGLWLVPLAQARSVSQNGVIGDYFSYDYNSDDIQIYVDAGQIGRSPTQILKINESYGITLVLHPIPVGNPQLFIDPNYRTVGHEEGTTTLNINNTGTGEMYWNVSIQTS